ncbi:MAG: heparinase II/III family protein, partial [bacterium]
PNPNDAWPNLNLKSYEYVYCIASKVFGDESPVTDIYKHIIAGTSERGDFPLSKPYYYNNDISFERLVCHPDIDFNNRTEIERKSVCFRKSYFGMLKNDNINVFMKYGHRGPSHAHPDKMNIEVMVKDYVLSRDLSNTGYASKLCNEWHRKTISHDTVLVDGENQTNMEGGEVLEFTDNICHTEVKDVYEGVHYNRRIEINEQGYDDVFKVSSEDEHNYDWLFHSEAELLTEVKGEDASLGYDKNGYEHVKETKRIQVEGNEFVLKWKLGDVELESVVDVTDKEVFMAQTYDNPVSSYRTAIILRAKAKEAEFKATWKLV